ncbi:hypothetical protein GGF46_001075 [Coemansia sp. RSA 552]|nr:hypothetical protein GGF46_001075 [Coemansia sp. RSA 552]
MALRRETPLPWAKLSVLLIVRFIEPLNFSLVLPFLYEMVKGLDIANAPQDVSFYAGLLLTSFYISQSLTSMLWSPLSDRIGRRPVLLLCLVGDLATFVLFGFSKSFAWALAARSLNGLFTGNSALLKSVVVDIADDTNRARMMSLLPLVFFAGNIAGAAIGGVLADPARQYPHLFGDIGLFIEYPYLLAANIAPSKASIGAMNGLQQMAMGVCTLPASVNVFTAR